MAKLPPKRAAFVREYVKDFNGTQAAIRAGYSPKSATAQASYLLMIPNVQDAVQKLKDKAEDAAIMDYREMCKSISSMARRRITDYIDNSGSIDINRGDPAAVVSLDVASTDVRTTTTKIRLVDPLRAMDQLAKLRNYYPPTKTEISTPPGGTIAIEVLTEEQAIDRYTQSLLRAAAVDAVD